MKNIALAFALIFALTINAQDAIKKDIGEFTEVKAFDLINLKMIKSNRNSVEITGKNRGDVNIVNKNGKLKIRMDVEEIYDGNDTVVILYFTGVETIDGNEGAEITVETPIKQFEINLKAQEGAEITVEANTSYAKIKSVTGGIINLTGKSKKQDINVSTGGVFNAQEFTTEFTEVSISAGGEARVNASEKVDIKIKAGGDVFVYGNPKLIDEKRVLGGRVKRM
ncbi:head GIN domain-containing protein [Winogradskyella immobilis]|uniref:DUF2807 domain-containing protein n=1 Tax=Winogradskyella immobilis TaxID=2816852 RepID=A0ABS8EJR5_9FLAO|nr:head GIN domain-containing protein [Winogradskyella immobilis]MCC1483443.1 DUF2807 domain-containing protein [Winogradskyella immobilis]MCG0015537.1 DUF2807 domain-containing protein [Winogradskyella immobilis]